MKKYTLCTIGIFLALLFLKIQLDSDKIGTRHLPKSLKPLEASYEASSVQQYSFGFNSLISSLLWVEVLQKSEHEPLKSDEVSWEYAQIDTITTLDRRFATGYAYGAVLLSVLRRDKLGGRLILEKWAKRYPTYWKPVQMLAMHYYEELGDYKSAAPLMLRASRMQNSPPWLSSLGLRLLSDSGSLIHAITTAVEISKTTKEGNALVFVSNRIRALNYNLQKKEFESRYTKVASNVGRELASLNLGAQEQVPDLIKSVLNEKFEFRWDSNEKRAVSLNPNLEKMLERTGIFVEPTAVKRVQ